VTRTRKRWLVGVVVAAAVLVALVPVGRWEARRHARSELAGIRSVLAEIGPIDQPSLDAYRVGVGPGMDCLLYRRGTNPFALEFCFDPHGRVIEAIDRRGDGPRIWSIREDPSASDVQIDRAKLVTLIDRLQQPAG
jgi:hypothetical protein